MSVHGFNVSSFYPCSNSLSDRWLAQGSPCTLPLIYPYILLCSHTAIHFLLFTQKKSVVISSAKTLICTSSVVRQKKKKKQFCSQSLAKTQRDHSKGSLVYLHSVHTVHTYMVTHAEYAKLVPI